MLSLAVLPRMDILKKSDEEIKLAEISENLPELKIVKGRKSDYSNQIFLINAELCTVLEMP